MVERLLDQLKAAGALDFAQRNQSLPQLIHNSFWIVQQPGEACYSNRDQLDLAHESLSTGVNRCIA